MKRFLICVAAMLLSFHTFAGVVTREKAEDIARAFLGSSKVEYAWNGLDDARYGTVQPAFYLFNGGGKWAIISADDIAVPVLMHGDGYLDPEEIPENMRMFLNGIGSNIIEASAQGFEQSDDVRELWNDIIPDVSTSDYSEKLLETAKWGQGTPYNGSCPTINGEKCIVGCVAVAMAIVMRYHKYPEYGTGTVKNYKTRTSGIEVGEMVLGNKYDWDNMPLTDGSKTENAWTDAQKTEVATLMAQCGAMVQMNYGLSSSGAYSRDIVPALIEHMSYSASAREFYRSGFTNKEWFNRIKAEIDADCPVIYGGQDSNGHGGHQFVCDGYNSNSEVHINWGWKGSSNDYWYALNYLGHPNTKYVFNYDDTAIFGLTPDPTGNASPSFDLYYMAGLTIDRGQLPVDKEFDVSVVIGNFSLSTFEGTAGVLLLDKSGDVKAVLSSIDNVTLPSRQGKSFSFKCSFTGSYALGDHLKAGYKDTSGKWQTLGLYPNYASAVPSIGVYDITLIDVPSSLSAGQICYLDLIVGQKALDYVEWYYDDAELPEAFVEVSSGTHAIKAEVTYTDGSTETVVKKITVN